VLFRLTLFARITSGLEKLLNKLCALQEHLGDLGCPSISTTSSTNPAGTTMRSLLSSTSILWSSVVAACFHLFPCEYKDFTRITMAHFAVASEVGSGIITRGMFKFTGLAAYTSACIIGTLKGRFSSELACILCPNQSMFGCGLVRTQDAGVLTFGILLSCLGLSDLRGSNDFKDSFEAGFSELPNFFGIVVLVIAILGSFLSTSGGRNFGHITW
jgi:hypothetical protein